MAIPGVLSDLLNLPTAAFVEHAVRDHLAAACDKLAGVTRKLDRHGNLVARYRRNPPRRPPLVFTAHMDHPGFCSLRMTGRKKLLAAFRGWVEPEYFAGQRVRFWSGGRWIKGRVASIEKVAPVYGLIGRSGRPEEVAIAVEGDVAPNAPGMWDLPDAYEKKDCVHARGCDDIAGAAGLLAMLQQLSRSRAAADVIVLFTRAEEVGFVGAIAASRTGTIPRKLPIIAIETSKAIQGVQMGGGPILRVGDKTSIFTPALTAYCEHVAKSLAGISTKKPAQAGQGGFKFQRKLMDGGTCESTAYIAYGYAATGICLGLGNYHNMNMDKRRIESEYVHLDDWRWMVEWFVSLACDRGDWRDGDPAVREAMDQRYDKYLPLLHEGPRARRFAKA
ncbi:MAG: M20/M25/M40 family metallo-hydrolase [Phycisphaerales bacterium]|nr:M20/M25/M40 family metallo-hydrolase [Phycisphaerales bacterium]